MVARWQSLVVSLVLVVPAPAQQVRREVDGSSTGHVGHAVAGVSDLDGDGVREIALSTWGGARVLSGATGADLSFLPIASPTLTTGFIVPIDVGDLDGDGVADIALGSRYDNDVRFFSGATAQLFDEVQGTGAFGSDVASVGDVDGDGLSEVLIGADNGSGSARLVRGSDRSALLTLNGPSSSAGFGTALAAPGDLDGDGVREYAIGAPGVSSFRGAVYAYSGATAAVLWTADGAATNDAFGISLDAHEDLDGDGVDDYGAGTWHTAEYVRVFSGANGQRLAEFREQAQFNALSLAGAGDLDGDGRADFVGGIEGHYVGGQPYGAVYAVVQSGPDIGYGLGFGDGSGSACPCANFGATGEGCRNSTGSGATLSAYGWSSIASTALRFRAEQLPSGLNAVLFSAPHTVPSAGVPFYDGLKLVSSPSRRWGLQAAGAFGRAQWQLDSADAAAAGWLPGVNQFFQIWYRDGSGPCGHGSNFTPAERVSFSL